MKTKTKKYYLMVLVLVVFMVTGCGSDSGTNNNSVLADSFNEDAVITQAKSVIEVINTKDYTAICSQLREDLQSQITAEDLETTWKAQLDNIGDFQDYSSITVTGTKSESTGEDYAVAAAVCTYSNGTATYTLSFDTDMQLVGLYMK